MNLEFLPDDRAPVRASQGRSRHVKFWSEQRREGTGQACGFKDVSVPAYIRTMSMTVAEVEQALLALDRHDRAEVLHRGIRSLEMDDPFAEEQAEVDAAWRAEFRRRIDDIESGKVELLDADESHAQLRAELAARRK